MTKQLQALDRREQVGERVVKFSPSPAMISAVVWVLENVAGEASQATLVEVLTEEILKAALAEGYRAPCEGSKSKRLSCESPGPRV